MESERSIRLFIDHLKIDLGLSENTRLAYQRDLNQLHQHLHQQKVEWTEVDERHLQDFLKTETIAQQKSSSIARKISAIKQFFKFLIIEQIITDDPSLLIESPTQTKALPKALDTKQIELLLATVDQGLPYEGTLATSLRSRDRAMVYLLYACGLRVTELITLKTHQVDIEGGFVRTVGKRSKERIVPFPVLLSELLFDYSSNERPKLKPTVDAFFIGHRGDSITRQSFWKTLKQIAAQAGIPSNLHPHVLRHTFATDLLKSGMSLRTLQSLLGHADLQTTQIYTQVAPDTLQKVIRRYHPRGDGNTES